MKKIKYYEDLNKYKSIIKRIRDIYSTIMNIPEYDFTIPNDDNFIHLGGLPFKKYGYENFIKLLENEFEIPLLNEFWNNEPDFMDVTDDKYYTFDGMTEYILSQLK